MIAARDWGRFEEKFTPEPNSGCWLWTAGCFKRGYGAFKIGGKLKKAHRVSYLHHNGSFPEVLQVLHRCDVPSCVNPNHLFLGTAADNIADMITKGRARLRVEPKNRARGERGGKSALNTAAVQAIRQSSAPLATLARTFGVTRQCVWKIRHGKAWKHVTC